MNSTDVPRQEKMGPPNITVTPGTAVTGDDPRNSMDLGEKYPLVVDFLMGKVQEQFLFNPLFNSLLEHVNEKGVLRVLDIGTGSGATIIPLTRLLTRFFPGVKIEIHMVDIRDLDVSEMHFPKEAPERVSYFVYPKTDIGGFVPSEPFNIILGANTEYLVTNGSVDRRTSIVNHLRKYIEYFLSKVTFIAFAPAGMKGEPLFKGSGWECISIENGDHLLEWYMV